MSKKSYNDLNAELLLERKENYPCSGKISRATVLAKNSRGLYLDIAKTYEAYVSTKDLGNRNLEDYKIGESVEIYITDEDRNQSGIFRSSIKQLDESRKWTELEMLKNQNLELKIDKVLKSGVEVEIIITKQIGFIPYGYLDAREEPLKSTKKENWAGLMIPGRIHELDQSKNKIILNHKVITEEHKEAKAKEVLSNISLGQTITCTVVRTADFGVFVDIGGFDALIPSSELSWRRFKKPSDIVKAGDKLEAKIFKIEPEQKRVALSVKQASPDPWTVIPAEFKIGYQGIAPVVTHAEFGVFVEVLPGVEALLHKTNLGETEKPELGSDVEFEITNLDITKKRMGIKLATNSPKKTINEEANGNSTTESKEPEYV